MALNALNRLLGRILTYCQHGNNRFNGLLPYLQIEESADDIGEFDMKLRFGLANRKTGEFRLPSNVRVYRALLWVEEDGKKKVETKVIMVPDEVRTIKVFGDKGEACAISRGRFVELKQPQKPRKKKNSSDKELITKFDATYQKGPSVKYQNPNAW
jgi:hypothetical protein